MPFTQEQLEERRGFLGASECASALGASPFFSQVELYLSKIGDGEPIEETIPMMVGTALEPVTLALFEKETQLKVSHRQAQAVDPLAPWRRCTVDGMAQDGWIIEAKTSGDFRGWGDGDDAVPLHYLYNAHHSMGCLPDAPGVYMPVLIGARTFRNYVIPRDPELIDIVKHLEEAFMRRVRERRAPDPESRGDVLKLYPKDLGTAIPAPPHIEGLVRAHAELKAQAKDLDERIDQHVKEITAFMGLAGTLKRSALQNPAGAVLATWNGQDRRSIDADALRAKYPDIAKAVTKITSTRVFLNKVKVF